MGHKVKLLVFISALSTQYIMNHLPDNYQTWYSGCHYRVDSFIVCIQPFWNLHQSAYMFLNHFLVISKSGTFYLILTMIQLNGKSTKYLCTYSWASIRRLMHAAGENSLHVWPGHTALLCDGWGEVSLSMNPTNQCNLTNRSAFYTVFTLWHLGYTIHSRHYNWNDGQTLYREIFLPLW